MQRFRPDGQVGHTRFTGTGRTWKSVVLVMSGCSLPRLTRSYNQNVLSTPTIVFNGPTTWPTLTGRTRSTPAQWLIKFPFKTTWRPQRTLDILADFTFNGGTLANNASWTTHVNNNYYLDSYYEGSYAFGIASRLGKYGPFGGCVDRGAAAKYGADTQAGCTTYGPSYNVASFRNKHRLLSRLVGAGPGANALQVIGVVKRSGANFPGVGCQKLWLDLSQPFITSAIKVGTSGNTGYNYWGFPNGLFPRNPAIEGLQFGVQSAWDDTKDKSLKLSACAWTHIPVLPRFTSGPKVPHRCVWVIVTAGNGPNWSPAYNPIRRYN